MTLVARPLAGPGLPGTALDVVYRQGWKIIDDEVGNAYAVAPGHRVIVAFLTDLTAPEPLDTERDEDDTASAPDLA